MLSQRFKTFKYAFDGIRDLIKTQPNAKVHLVATIIVVLGGFFFEVSITEWCILLLCIGFVFSAEAFNTSIEYLTDLVSPDIHPLAGKTKDAAAGAVLLVAISSALVGCIIFLPKIYRLIAPLF
ncbi:MAG: diacylglycerol kinase family protein [Bacteroidota bacterium]